MHGCHDMVVVALSSLARFWGECPTIHSPPALFFLFFLSGDRFEYASFTLSARESPQWLSGVRQLWASVPRRVVCELVSLIGYFRTMFGQHDQSTQT